MTTAAPEGATPAPGAAHPSTPPAPRPSDGPARAPAWAAALAGLAAGVVTVGVGSLVAIVAGAPTDPLVAVGAAFVDATPAWLKEVAASTFGTADKAVLMIGEAVVLAALAALAGVLAARRWAWGAAVVVVLGLVAMAAALGRPDASWTAMIPSFAGTVAGLWTLKALVDRLPRDVTRPRRQRRADDPTGRGEDTGPTDVPEGQGRSADDGPATEVTRGTDRRRFLQAAGVATALGLVAVAMGRLAGAAGRAVTAVRDTIRLPAPRTAAPAVPAGVDVGADGVGPWATPPDDFYRIDTALVVPQVDPTTWTLRVHGLVEQEVELTWDELLASDLVEAWVTLCCVSNPVGGDLVGNQRWLGLPVREVLARARPLGDADMVLSRSADGWTASTPLAALTDDRDALLAVGMDGAPLPVAHGFPVRLVVPGLYGYVSATKWVTELEVTRFADATAYWTDRGWSPHGPVKTQSRIDVPGDGAQLDAGEVVVAGTAWAQHRGITRVQVQVDRGPWQDATLADSGGIDSWRQWRWTWTATEPGRHELRVRAFDPDGPQTGAAAGVLPDGATGYDYVQVQVG
ncbi:molybdopterin-dependent oxidoreductase [Cellulomonas persica]|uniref:Oxidoreductase n=1 Tax=Cellulomonas persica TaxID=76861 RepID=A0A510UWB8_9CELL|nr:molybdopterin-dependent oxidoreductase [Cellulomonas persica]GEK17095.1 oxidoreductase [Cellulomonas persica]